MIAMRLSVVSLDEHFALEFFCGLNGDVQIVAGRILAVINHLAADAMQRAVIQLESFFGQAIFQSIERVVMQVISDMQGVQSISIFNLAVRQTGQKLIGARYLSGRIRTEYDFTMFLQFNSIAHSGPANRRSFALQYLHTLKQIQSLIKLIVIF